MKEQRLELRLTSLELDRLKLLAAEVEREYGFKISLQEVTRALMELVFADEPPEGFETVKGTFKLLHIIANFPDWNDKKKIEEELATILADLDFLKFVAEYKSLTEKARDYCLTKKEKSRLEVLRKRAERESQKIEAEKIKIRQWQKEGRYTSRRRRKE